jgi:hypothetical protein
MGRRAPPLLPFGHLLVDLASGGTEIFGRRSEYHGFTLVLTALVMLLGLSWHSVFRYVRRRGELSARVSVSRWGSLAWIAILLLVATLPWRVMNDNAHERALLDGERAYIVAETRTEVLLFRPELGATTRHEKSPDLVLTRLGIPGFAFEEASTFHSGVPSA